MAALSADTSFAGDASSLSEIFPSGLCETSDLPTKSSSADLAGRVPFSTMTFTLASALGGEVDILRSNPYWMGHILPGPRAEDRKYSVDT